MSAFTKHIFALTLLPTLVVPGWIKLPTNLPQDLAASFFGKPENIPISTEQMIDLVRPAVVRIALRAYGTLRYPAPLNRRGNFVPTREIVERRVHVGFIGSGFIVNENGYIITNAHVVDHLIDNLTPYLLDKVVGEIKNDVARENPELPPAVLNLTAEELKDYFLRYANERPYGWYDVIYNLIIFNPEQKSGTLDEYIDKGFEAEIKKPGEPFPNLGKDIAILKIEKKDLPIIKLIDDSGKLKEGAKLFSVGFPAAADVTINELLKATLTQGVLGAIKESPQGQYKVFQTDALITPGNSGGPILNEQGLAVGVATFVTGTGEGATFNFAIPANIVRELMNELNVKNDGGTVQEHFEKGLKFYWRKECLKAKEEFQLAKSLAGFNFLDDYIKKCEEIIARGESRRVFYVAVVPLSMDTILAGSLGVVAIFTLIFIFFLRRKRKKALSAFVNVPPQSLLQYPFQATPRYPSPSTSQPPPQQMTSQPPSTESVFPQPTISQTKPQSAPPEPVDAQLIVYIKAAQASGLSEGQIIQELQKVGWQEYQIAKAFQKIASGQ